MYLHVLYGGSVYSPDGFGLRLDYSDIQKIEIVLFNLTPSPNISDVFLNNIYSKYPVISCEHIGIYIITLLKSLMVLTLVFKLKI